MKYIIGSILSLFFHLTYACQCEVKQEIDIIDWNDTDVIFTGTLTKFEESPTATELFFLISETYKGELNFKSIHFSIDADHHHEDVFHHIDAIVVGQKWIVFSTQYIVDNKVTYKLKQSETTDFCLLSKPISDKDQYVSFAREIGKYPNVTNKSFNRNEQIFAQGSLKNKIPTGTWKYFTREDLQHFWEGEYVNGKRDGKWIEKAINHKNQNVIINEAFYKKGILNEQIEYNYVGEKKSHEIHKHRIKKRITYYQNVVVSIKIYDKTSNTTTTEIYKNGKSVGKTTVIGELF